MPMPRADPAQRQPTPDRRETRQQKVAPPHRTRHEPGVEFPSRVGSSLKMLTPREQGDFGELSAMHWLAWQGASVALPVGNSPHWDLMAELDGRATARPGEDLSLRQQAAAGRSRVCDARRQSELERVWRSTSIPADSTTSSSSSATDAGGSSRRTASRAAAGSRLGGPKYAEFEVDRGDPIPGCTVEEARLYNRLLNRSGGCPSG